MIPNKPIPGEAATGNRSPTAIVGEIIDTLAVLNKIEGSPPILVERGVNGIVIRLEGAVGTGPLTVARVSDEIVRKGSGKAYALEWDGDTEKYREPSQREPVTVYDVLQNYGLGPVKVGADILMQIGNSGEWELVQVTCPQGA